MMLVYKPNGLEFSVRVFERVFDSQDSFLSSSQYTK